MTTLKKTLETLASEFAEGALAAIRAASLSELVESPSPASTIPVRRRDGSVVHIGRDVLALTGLLSTSPGLRSEQIRKHLRWDKKAATKAITRALAEKRITKTGQRRATKYYVA